MRNSWRSKRDSVDRRIRQHTVDVLVEGEVAVFLSIIRFHARVCITERRQSTQVMEVTDEVLAPIAYARDSNSGSLFDRPRTFHFRSLLYAVATSHRQDMARDRRLQQFDASFCGVPLP